MKGTVRKGLTPENSFTEHTTESCDSVELKMSAKGERYWDIKVYFIPGEEAEALARLTELDTALQARFGKKEEKA